MSDDVKSVLAGVAELIPDRRYVDIEWRLRRALSDHRDDPHIHLLLGMVKLHGQAWDDNAWDRVRPHLARARELAPGDDYVLDGVAAFELIHGDAWAVDRARARMKARAAGKPKSQPPEQWPTDIVRDLRRSMWSGGTSRKRVVEAFTATLAADDGRLASLWREAGAAGNEAAMELYEETRQLSAQARLERRQQTSAARRASR